jgi:2,4-dienoyl-CoA reductase (NADPH2)
LGYRLPIREWVPDGVQLEDAITFTRLLEQAGVSYISAAAANFNSIFSTPVMKKMGQLAYLREDMVRLTSRVTIPTIISGRITTPALAEALLKQGAADLVGLGRPLRVDADWVKKTLKPTSPIKLCMNCNWCLKSVVLEQGFVCQRWIRTTQLKTQLARMMLTRNFNGLWVIADEEDLVLFKEAAPDLMPANQGSKWFHPITILLGESLPHVGSATRARTDFIAWIQSRSHNNIEILTRTQPSVGKKIHNSWDRDIREEINRRNQGLVLIGRKRNQPWRERLLYTLRHRVVGLINPNNRLKNVAVFLDFSDASLLALAYVRQAFINRPGVRLRFVHALDGSKTRADRHWSRLKKVVGLNQEEQLTCIPSGENPVAAIMEEIARGRYGTIVMGKRGLTGIKRLLLGSVSRAVLRKIKDQTLFLVD